MKIGDKIFRLTLLKKAENHKWLCRCECGKEKEISKYSLAKMSVKSCGCYKRDLLNSFNKTHGMTATRIYRIWSGMKKRCDNPRFKHYKWYGGRGITYSKKWESFERFYLDMKDGYEDNLTLERIDRNSNYCKKNCKWATVLEQMNNHGECVFVTIGKETKSVSDWCRKFGVSYNTIMTRVARQNLSHKEALLKPVKPSKHPRRTL